MRHRALMLTVLLLSAACSQVPPQDPSPVRVIIRFEKPVQGDGKSVLSNLAQVSGVDVHFAAAVSDREYAYVLACPSGDPGCEKAIGALGAWGQIERINLDNVKRIQN